MQRKGRQFHAKALLGFLIDKGTVVGLLIALQLAMIGFGVYLLAENFAWMYVFFVTLSICILIWLVNKEESPSYKLPWAIAITAFPVFGGLLYLTMGNKAVPPKTAARFQKLQKTEQKLLMNYSQNIPFSVLSEQCAPIASFLENIGSFPVCKNEGAQFFSLGETMWKQMLKDLRNAKKFIFMEYFILEHGVMLDEILSILWEKSAAGVEVRLMYDDVGSMRTLPLRFRREMKSKGVSCVVFNPLRIGLGGMFNFRDHRKICVIDGDIGYCGGQNLADEYINQYEKHGHWKDSAVRITGRNVWGLTCMFLTLWQFASGGEQSDFVEKYGSFERRFPPQKGYIQVFGDSPLDRLSVFQQTFMQIINRAKKYVYITTPYLVLDSAMVTALQMASRSGVEVCLLLPGKPDHWYVQETSRSFYGSLLQAGVHIYEYSPGFIHEKMIVSDDEIAIVGTANMDFRSFFLHFECGVAFYGGDMVETVKSDILSTVEKCKKIPQNYASSVSLPKRLVRSVLRLFGPMM